MGEILNIKYDKLFINEDFSDLKLNQQYFNQNTKLIFNIYDSNQDKNLDSNELSSFISDIKNIASDDKDLSTSDIKQLLKKILPNSNIPTDVFRDFLFTIQERLLDYITTNSNKKIDNVHQGGADCWLLSGLKALSNTNWGAEAIENSVKYSENESVYTVYLTGVKFETNITEQDIACARQQSNYNRHDIDALLIEMAIEKYLKQEVLSGSISRKEDLLQAGMQSGLRSIQYFLTGKTGHTFYLNRDNNPIDESLLSESQKSDIKNSRDFASSTLDVENIYSLLKNIEKNKNNTAITCSFHEKNEWLNNKKYKKCNEDFLTSSGHCYEISDIISNNNEITAIIITNPHDSSLKIKLPIDEFLDKVLSIGITIENDLYDDYNKHFGPTKWQDLKL